MDLTKPASILTRATPARFEGLAARHGRDAAGSRGRGELGNDPDRTGLLLSVMLDGLTVTQA
jgi:hypothetical protein